MNRTYQITTTRQTRPWLQPWTLPNSVLPARTPRSELEIQAAGFAPISLKQMDAVALLNRIDTKFVMTTEQLLTALAAIQNDYWILSINGQRLNHYRTLYFDTPDFELYHAHVNERAERYKVRSREYTDSNLSFLEVKHRTRKDRTIKERVPTAQQVVCMTSEVEDWLHGVLPMDSSRLEPKIWNSFTRITLVSKKCCERVTLDTNLAFYANEKEIKLDGIAIAEVKMDSDNRESAIMAQMRAQKIREQGFSKYSIGVAMLYDQVKKNALKPKMLWVEKMMRGPVYYE